MKRRDVLKRVAAVGAAGSIAGCTGRQSVPGGESDGDETTTTTTATTTTTEEPLSIASESIESGGTCGQENSASVSFEGESVTVEGSIPTSTPCYEAVLSETSLDEGSGELTVTVSVTETDADMCQQCLGRVDYEATVTTSRAVQSVRVNHAGVEGGSPVTTATNDG